LKEYYNIYKDQKEFFSSKKTFPISFRINSLKRLKSNIIKYVTRHPYKGKSLQDLKKARWYLDRLIQEVEAKEGK